MSATADNSTRVRSLAISAGDRERLKAARIASLTLLVCLAIVYSGGERYFYLISHTLEYGFYMLMVACVLLIVGTSGIRTGAILCALPYVAFVVAYTVWGLIVSPVQSQVAADAAKAALLNVFLFAGVLAAVRDRWALATLAFLIQLAALGNVALLLWETADHTVTRSLANFGQTVYDIVERPGGLWVQPNDAAVAFLFASLLSFWARGPRAIIWLARLGAAVAIFLTASRTGMYPLILCSALFGVMALMTSRVDRRLWIVVLGLGGAAAVLIGAAFLFAEGPLVATWLATNYDLTRFLDLGQSLRAASDPSRTDSARVWLAKAIGGPWQGAGIYSFQGSLTLQGAHDMYIMVWGETSIASLVAYVGVLGFGLLRSLRRAIPTRDRVSLVTMWAVYLAIGLSTHNQFTSVVGITVVALLYCLPEVLSERDPGSLADKALGRPGLSQFA